MIFFYYFFLDEMSFSKQFVKVSFTLLKKLFLIRKLIFLEIKFKEISAFVQGAIDFLSSIDPRRRTDEQRRDEMIDLLHKITLDRGNKQVLKNLLGRIFGSVWKSVCCCFYSCSRKKRKLYKQRKYRKCL